MHRLIFVAAVALSLSACKKESAEQKPSTASSDESGTAAKPVAEAETAPPAEPPAAEEQRIQVTPELVAKYVAFQRDSLTALTEEMEKFKQTAESAKGDSTAAMKVAAASTSMTETVKKRNEAARASHGLSEEQVDAVRDVVDDTVFIHKTALKNKPESEKSIADIKKNLEAAKDAPPEQRAAAESMLKAMEEGMKRQLDLPEARAEHGDAAVDAVLAHEDAIYDLQMKAMSLGR